MAKVKNWAKFQHYKNRCPPWIKLQKELLDDFEYACLPIASKALAPLLWLLASETTEGEVTVDAERLAFRLRWPINDIRDGLSPLIERGFLICASAELAACKHVAPKSCSETEAETEGERTPSPPAAAFDFKADLFARWKALPASGGGAFLNKLFRDHKPEQRVVEAVERTLDHGPADPKAFVLGVLRKEAAAEDAYDALMKGAI